MDTFKFYDNPYELANKGKQITDINKLYEGQYYLLDMNGTIKCGYLIQKTLSNSTTDINYYGMYFKVGNSILDGVTLINQIRQYHIQSHCNLDIMKLKIYEYYFSVNLQKQIKWFKYYKKTTNNLCTELNIPEDIQKIIFKYLINAK